MPSMLKGQMAIMRDMKVMDDMGMGNLAISVQACRNPKKREKLLNECIEKGWIRTEPRDDIWLRTLYMTTKGLHALQAAERRLGNGKQRSSGRTSPRTGRRAKKRRRQDVGEERFRPWDGV